jgi:hypothetical protein
MAPSKYKDKDAGVVVAFNGSWVSWLHTGAAYGKLIRPRPSISSLLGSLADRCCDNDV